MTLPARQSRGSLGANAALAAATTHEFEDFAPTGANFVCFYFRTNQIGTLRVERIALNTVLQRVRAIEVTDPTDEVLVRVDMPSLGSWRIFFTNNGGGPAAISLEGTWG